MLRCALVHIPTISTLLSNRTSSHPYLVHSTLHYIAPQTARFHTLVQGLCLFMHSLRVREEHTHYFRLDPGASIPSSASDKSGSIAGSREEASRALEREHREEGEALWAFGYAAVRAVIAPAFWKMLRGVYLVGTVVTGKRRQLERASTSTPILQGKEVTVCSVLLQLYPSLHFYALIRY
jgi:hypothetical protein